MILTFTKIVSHNLTTVFASPSVTESVDSFLFTPQFMKFLILTFCFIFMFLPSHILFLSIVVLIIDTFLSRSLICSTFILLFFLESTNFGFLSLADWMIKCIEDLMVSWPECCLSFYQSEIRFLIKIAIEAVNCSFHFKYLQGFYFFTQQFFLGTDFPFSYFRLIFLELVAFSMILNFCFYYWSTFTIFFTQFRH